MLSLQEDRPPEDQRQMNPIQIHDNSVFAKPERYPGFERWWHRVIVATEVMVAFNIVCGLLGLFGTGPLSSASARVETPDVTLKYQRFTRRFVKSELVIQANRPLPNRTLEILLPRAFGAAFEVEATSPPARDIHAEKDGIVYAFDFGQTREGEAHFSIKARDPGLVDATIKVGDGSATLRQIIWP